MLIFAILLLIAFSTIAFFVWKLSRAAECKHVSQAVCEFAGEAKFPKAYKLTYTGPHEINTDLVGIGFTVSSLPIQGQEAKEDAGKSSRLSISLNAGKHKPWWVMYEEVKQDEVSGMMVRAERHEAKFRAKTETAVWLEILRKAAAGALLPPAPREPMPDPFETPPDDDPPIAA